MEINTWLLITLFVSSALNGSLFWLVREQSSRLATTADNAEDLLEMINGFKNHLKAVYSLETFYGDETLKALMDHATSLSIILEEQYGEIASLSEPIEFIEEEEGQDGSEENQNEKHVLYAGTRRRDS
jgi:hypothetical protein